MRVFFSSDTHYFHHNIIKYCERPFSNSSEMNRFMMESWNSVITDEDIAFHVGDFSLSRSTSPEEVAKIVRCLKGKKILIRGNHDEGYDDSFFLNAGFKVVVDSINLGGVLLIHYPLHEAFARKVRDSHWGDVSHVIHGHTHKKGPELEAHFNVAVDRHDFLPVSADEAIPSTLQDSFFQSMKSTFPVLF